MLIQLYIELFPKHLLKMIQGEIPLSILIFRGNTHPSQEIQVLTLKSQVSSFLKHKIK